MKISHGLTLATGVMSKLKLQISFGCANVTWELEVLLAMVKFPGKISPKFSQVKIILSDVDVFMQCAHYIHMKHVQSLSEKNFLFSC